MFFWTRDSALDLMATVDSITPVYNRFYQDTIERANAPVELVGIGHVALAAYVHPTAKNHYDALGMLVQYLNAMEARLAPTAAEAAFAEAVVEVNVA